MFATNSSSAPLRALSVKIDPMPLSQSLLYFGLPALLFRISIYNGTPALISLGLTTFEATVIAFTAPSVILFAFALGFYRRDGYPLSWGNLKARFRLLHIARKDWLWTMGAFIASFLSIGALSFTAPLLITAVPTIAPPDFFPPWLKPGTNFSVGLFAEFIGAPPRGNWGAAILFFVMLFFNIAGEELWWRGYILPRQEQAYGRWAWGVHGVLWLLWHLVFYPWQMFALLPICLGIPFVAQRLGNTWPAIIIHMQNGIVMLLILAMVLGMV